MVSRKTGLRGGGDGEGGGGGDGGGGVDMPVFLVPVCRLFLRTGLSSVSFLTVAVCRVPLCRQCRNDCNVCVLPSTALTYVCVCVCVCARLCVHSACVRVCARCVCMRAPYVLCRMKTESKTVAPHTQKTSQQKRAS